MKQYFYTFIFSLAVVYISMYVIHGLQYYLVLVSGPQFLGELLAIVSSILKSPVVMLDTSITFKELSVPLGYSANLNSRSIPIAGKQIEYIFPSIFWAIAAVIFRVKKMKSNNLKKYNK